MKKSNAPGSLLGRATKLGGRMSGLDELDKLTDESELFWVTVAIGGAVLAAFVTGLVVGLWAA